MRRGFLRLPANLVLIRRLRSSSLGLAAAAGLLLPGATALVAQSGAVRRPLEIDVANVDSLGVVCLRYDGPTLPAGARIWLVQPDTPQSVAQGVPATGRCTVRPELEEGSLLPVRITGGVLDSARLSVGIVGYGGTPTVRGGVVSADLDGDGVPEHFRACTSGEGVHLSIWSGPPATDRLRWHRYRYLGYDVVPTCTPRDIREPAAADRLGRPAPTSAGAP